MKLSEFLVVIAAFDVLYETSARELNQGSAIARQAAIIRPQSPPPSPTNQNARQCAAGWVEADGTCYLAVYKSKNARRLNWAEARHHCVLLGGDLASIHSLNATQVLRSAIERAHIHYWIGLNARADSQRYVWSDGSSPNYFNWKSNEPNNFNSRLNCVQLDGRYMTWSVTSCAGSNNWICETPKGINPGNVTTPTPTEEPELPGCPRFYFRFRDSCYRAISTFLDWFASRDYCRRFGAEIVSISDQEEQDFVLRLVNRVTKTSSMWIGLNEFGQNDGFRWADGTPVTYVNWNNGEPNNAGGAEHCVSLYAFNGLWNDDQCGTRTSVVCKYNNRTVNSTLAPQTPMPGECPTGFYSVGDKCFRLFNKQTDQLTWRDAFDRCNTLGGANRSYLASVSNEFEQAKLISLAKDSQINLWIGLHSRSTIPRRYVWIDNSRVSYTNWARGQPSGSALSNCVTMLTEKYRAGKWADVLCNQTRGFICMTYKQISIRTTWPGPVPTRVLCQQGWVQYGDACFQLNADAVSWQNAQMNCANAGANLASVHDVWEQNFLHSLTQNIDGFGTWIGLNDQKNVGQYLWSDGWPVLYSFWEKSYPRSSDLLRCVSTNRNGRWRNADCRSSLPHLCRKNLRQSTSTHAQPTTTTTSTQQQRTTHNNGQNTRQTQYTSRTSSSRTDPSTRPPIGEKVVPDFRNDLLIGCGVAFILLALIAMVAGVFVIKRRQQKTNNGVGFGNANWSRDSGNVQINNTGTGVGGSVGDEAFENKGFNVAEA